jgi:DNA-binding GntR family transcriptional regulator
VCVVNRTERNDDRTVTAGRTLLREHVKEVVLERILSGHYAPGERLVETRIARELGTSQAPVREALRQLELLEFVESEPFRGARVREISLAEFLEVYPVRSVLEEAAVREAAGRLNGNVARLARELEAMRRAAARGDVSEQVARDVAFHRHIVEAAGNRTLLGVWDSLGTRERTLVTFLAGTQTGPEVVESHVPILDALRSGDAERSAACVRQHFTTFATLLRERAG